ncbi:hypothetical protein NMG60_11008446 [Bertholletia excelsa]
MENIEISLDPETEFLYSKRETGNEWELFKENVKPMKRGRNVHLLNNALKSQIDNQLKKSLLDTRRKLIAAIDEYKGDDPLQPWLECIKWVQEAFPPGGDCSGLVPIYEQCVRSFWHDDHYKDDLRYLKIWLEYAENCDDAEVIYCFLEANKIGQTHSIFFISYAVLMESKNKIKTADEIFNRGISRNAQPIEKLKVAYQKFIARSIRRPKTKDEDSIESHFPVRSFGTVLGNQTTENSGWPRKKMRQDKAQGTTLSIYKDSNADISLDYQPGMPKTDTKSWHNLGARAERNKENNAIPTKWTTNKVSRGLGPRAGAAPANVCIEVFVDDECEGTNKMGTEGGKSSSLQLRRIDGQDLKKETELLRENPLRYFPPSCLPR